MKIYKKFIFSKKCFSSVEKKAEILVNQASEKRGKAAKLKKMSTIQANSKVENCKKICLETSIGK